MKAVVSSCFHPGECPGRGLLRDYEPSCGPSFQALVQEAGGAAARVPADGARAPPGPGPPHGQRRDAEPAHLQPRRPRQELRQLGAAGRGVRVHGGRGGVRGGAQT